MKDKLNYRIVLLENESYGQIRLVTKTQSQSPVIFGSYRSFVKPLVRILSTHPRFILSSALDPLNCVWSPQLRLIPTCTFYSCYFEHNGWLTNATDCQRRLVHSTFSRICALGCFSVARFLYARARAWFSLNCLKVIPIEQILLLKHAKSYWKLDSLHVVHYTCNIEADLDFHVRIRMSEFILQQLCWMRRYRQPKSLTYAIFVLVV